MNYSFNKEILERSIQLQELQNATKKTILEKVDLHNINNGDRNIEYIYGSSCAALCDYCFIPTVGDLDLYVENKDNIIFVKGLDYGAHPLIHPTYKDRIVVVNGIKCLSEKDLGVNMFSILLKTKPSSHMNFMALMRGLESKEIQEMANEAINYCADAYPKEKVDMLRLNLAIFDSLCNKENLEQEKRYDEKVAKYWNLI